MTKLNSALIMILPLTFNCIFGMVKSAMDSQASKQDNLIALNQGLENSPDVYSFLNFKIEIPTYHTTGRTYTPTSINDSELDSFREKSLPIATDIMERFKNQYPLKQYRFDSEKKVVGSLGLSFLLTGDMDKYNVPDGIQEKYIFDHYIALKYSWIADNPTRIDSRTGQKLGKLTCTGEYGLTIADTEKERALAGKDLGKSVKQWENITEDVYKSLQDSLSIQRFSPETVLAELSQQAQGKISNFVVDIKQASNPM